MNCQQCGLEFSSLQEQRSHFKTEFHQYNLKRRLKGLEGISIQDYNVLADDLESLESQDSEEDQEDSEKDGDILILRNNPFKIIKHDSNFYKTFKILNLDEISLGKILNKEYNWVILMMASGHFAGGVFDPDGNVKVSKTFHRYTTRRKQGGAQSGKDNTGKMAKSAGSTLRRYNEAALKDEVQELLKSWKSYILQAQFIFIRAKNSNRAILNFDSKVLDLKDERIKNIPFTTKRPTIDEVKRCFKELLPQVIDSAELEDLMDHVDQVDNEQDQDISMQDLSIKDLQSQDVSSLELSKEVKDKVTTEVKVEKDAESKTFDRVADMIRRGKLNLVISQLNTNPFLAGMYDEEGNSLLHLSAIADQSEIVTFLLEFGLDGTFQNFKRQTPYQVSSSKSVRDTFRRFIAYNSPSWDISSSFIPEPLTREMEEKQKAKAKQKRSRKKSANPPSEEVIESVEKVKDDPKITRGSLPRLGISMMNSVAMSPEARIKLDRQKRAMAAERRISPKKCSHCGSDCTLDYFEKNNLMFCSTKCIRDSR